METEIVETKKADKGFTLVELLIVIVILGILATVTVFAVRGITDKGQENACLTEKRAIETAFEAFYAANDNTDATAWTDLVPNYLKTSPEDRWTATWGAPPTIAATALGTCA